MRCAECRDRLEDWLDGILPAREHRAVQHHLAGCPECRREAEAGAALARSVTELPREIAPRRDLWPGISTRLAAADPTGSASRFRWLPRPANPLAAAAAVLIVLLGALIVPRLTTNRGADREGFGWEHVIGLLTTAEMEQQYRGAADDLISSLAGMPAVLPDTAREVIEANLQLVEQAITESRTALTAYPSDAGLQSMLAAAYRHKIELLQHTARLTTVF